MGLAIFKRLMGIKNNIQLKNTGTTWYVFDKFYRFVSYGQPQDAIQYIYRGYNIYCTHHIQYNVRSIDNIKDIQAVSYYFRPSIYNIDYLKKLQGLNFVMIAGLTINNGLRVVVPVEYYGTISDSIERYNYCYNHVLDKLQACVNIPSPKSLSHDLLGCVGPLLKENTIINPNYTPVIIND